MCHISDLHIHSTASDGQYTPTQLVGMAKARGLDVFALTDQDTMDGLKEAIQAGKQCGLRVIPGVELSAKEYPTFHILGYGFKLGALPLAELCRRMKANREAFDRYLDTEEYHQKVKRAALGAGVHYRHQNLRRQGVAGPSVPGRDQQR